MRIFLSILFLGCACSAHAQFQVNLTLPRINFMALESIPASVTITNRSGGEIVLGGPGRESWLSFEMTDSTGRVLAPIDVSAEDMARVPPGGTIQRRVVVTDAYAPGDIGNYALTARVLHVPTKQFYVSNRLRFNITDNKPMWEQSYGVPEGFPGAGTARRYAILLFTDADTTSLYCRLIEEKSGLRLKTFRLGPVSMVHDPQITLDQQNNLQVLFLAQPHLYAHAIVNPDGVIKKLSYYREENGNRPQMSVSGDGNVKIAGGEYFDPTKPPPKPSNTGRNVSEKPPGL